MRKVSLLKSNIEINGMPWYKHNNSMMLRLSYELESEVNSEVWRLAKDTSGARIRFS